MRGQWRQVPEIGDDARSVRSSREAGPGGARSERPVARPPAFVPRETKFHPPRTPDRMVPRPHLVEGAVDRRDAARGAVRAGRLRQDPHRPPVARDRPPPGRVAPARCRRQRPGHAPAVRCARATGPVAAGPQGAGLARAPRAAGPGRHPAGAREGRLPGAALRAGPGRRARRAEPSVLARRRGSRGGAVGRLVTGHLQPQRSPAAFEPSALAGQAVGLRVRRSRLRSRRGRSPARPARPRVRRAHGGRPSRGHGRMGGGGVSRRTRLALRRLPAADAPLRRPAPDRRLPHRRSAGRAATRRGAVPDPHLDRVATLSGTCARSSPAATTAPSCSKPSSARTSSWRPSTIVASGTATITCSGSSSKWSSGVANRTSCRSFTGERPPGSRPRTTSRMPSNT